MPNTDGSLSDTAFSLSAQLAPFCNDTLLYIVLYIYIQCAYYRDCATLDNRLTWTLAVIAAESIEESL